MDPKLVYKNIFQAFGALSDAQELISVNRVRGANDLVSHAKLHLMEIIEADEEGYAEVMLSMSPTCTLGKEE